MSAVTTGCPADLAAAHTLLGCLAREVVGAGARLTDGYAELPLTGTGVRLRCAATRVTPLGEHRWTGPVLRSDGTGWSPPWTRSGWPGWSPPN